MTPPLVICLRLRLVKSLVGLGALLVHTQMLRVRWCFILLATRNSWDKINNRRLHSLPRGRFKVTCMTFASKNTSWRKKSLHIHGRSLSDWVWSTVGCTNWKCKEVKFFTLKCITCIFCEHDNYCFHILWLLLPWLWIHLSSLDPGLDNEPWKRTFFLHVCLYCVPSNVIEGNAFPIVLLWPLT